jgi:hypothetical protein
MPDMHAEFKIFRDLRAKFSIMIIKQTAMAYSYAAAALKD